MNTPQLGDVVRMNGELHVLSVYNDYGPEYFGVCRLQDVYGGAFFYGPSSKYGDQSVEHVSVSGGPHPSVKRSRLQPTGKTHEVVVWKWKDLPRAGGAEYYKRPVPLWEVV